MSIDQITHDVPLITNDAVVLGILLSILGMIFYTSKADGFKKFYNIIPALLLCYFLPSIVTSLGIFAPKWIDVTATIDALLGLGYDVGKVTDLESLKLFISENKISEETYSDFIGSSQLYFMASRYLLPASLVLLTISISLKEVVKLGPKALIMFFTATLGVMFGGPFAVLFFSWISPDLLADVNGSEIWTGLSTVAGSWIGGGANQAAMQALFEVNDQLYSVMITVDVIVAQVWMAFLLLGVAKAEKIDKFFKADSSSVENLKNKMHEFSTKSARNPTFNEIMIILMIGFGVTGLAHLVADFLAPLIEEKAPNLIDFGLASPFFWIIVVATTVGVCLSFTKAKNYEGAGASKIGSVFIYVLVATIGMKMDITAIFDNLGLFAIGGVWMLFHVGLLFLVAKLIKAPFFFLAVGSKANIGGAASAPVVAGAFHPSLAPVGVLLAVLGYALGTYGAWMCAIMMQWVST